MADFQKLLQDIQVRLLRLSEEEQELKRDKARVELETAELIRDAVKAAAAESAKTNAWPKINS